MKLSALLAIGAVATAGLSAVPAEAKHYGYGYRHGGRFDRGYRGYGYRGGYGHRGAYGYGGGYGYRGHYGYRGGGYYGRPRVACRIVRGYYGPERRCFRAF